MVSTLVITSIVVALAAVALAAFWWHRKSNSPGFAAPISSRHNRVLIYGPISSGKTLLFFQLIHGRNQETHTSMQANVKVFTPICGSKTGNQNAFEFIDFPGHSSLKFGLIRYYQNLKALIFMIDASTIHDRHRNSAYATFIMDSANMLYNLLILEDFFKNHPKILIVANKSDKVKVSEIKEIQTLLLFELNKLRISQTSVASISDSDANETESKLIDLIGIGNKAGAGNEKEQEQEQEQEMITWEDIPYDIQFASASVLTKQIDPIARFLNNL